MATGASTAQLAVILIDARKGVVRQTRRHSRIAALLGITHVVLAVNKMDLVAWDRATFDAIERSYRSSAENLGLSAIYSIPLSALNGDNVVRPSEHTPWYAGQTLLEYLECVELPQPSLDAQFRMPIQFVNRSGPDLRGYCGRVVAGTVRVGDRVRVCPTAAETEIKAIVVFEESLREASAGRSVMVTLTDDVDASRGMVLTAATAPVPVSDQFEARMVWFSERALIAGRSYLLKMHATQVPVTITEIKHRINVDTGEQCATEMLELNDIGVVRLSTSMSVAFEPYAVCRSLGAFILIDRLTNDTIGGGMIDFAPRRAANVYAQPFLIGKRDRAATKHQRALCIWLTGLPGAGKSTIANLLEQRLCSDGRHTFDLDGDNLRLGLNRDLGFSEAARTENTRRVAEVAHLMVEAGLIVIVSLISPFRADRWFARELFDDGEFIEVHVDAPQAVCERRDPKRLYFNARHGELLDLTGVGSAYEPPDHPELRIPTDDAEPDACVDQIVARIAEHVAQ